MELATCSHPLTALFVAVAFDALTLGRLGYYRLLQAIPPSIVVMSLPACIGVFGAVPEGRGSPQGGMVAVPGYLKGRGLTPQRTCVRMGKMNKDE